MAKFLFLLVVGLVIGCATTHLTEEEYVACKGNQHCLVAALEDKVEQEKYERQDLRIQRRDKLVAYIQGCYAGGNVILYRKSGSRLDKPLRDRKGNVQLPRGATRIDFQCLSPRAVRTLIRQATGSYDPRF